MKQSTKGSSSKRGAGSTSTSRRPSTSRSNLREEDQYDERSMGSRSGSMRDEGREGVRTISGRYSDFEDYGGSSRNRQDRDESDRGFARGGRRGEHSSVNDQDFYEGSSRSPWRDTYDTDRNDMYRGSSRSQNYGGQGRGYSEYESNDDSRMNSRGSRYGSSRSYNDSSGYDRGGIDRERYSDRDNRFMNNYDNQDESMEDEYGYRQRYNENRY